jgi:hypothetical protein
MSTGQVMLPTIKGVLQTGITPIPSQAGQLAFNVTDQTLYVSMLGVSGYRWLPLPDPLKTSIDIAVKERFYAFQNATSNLKRQGHNPDSTQFTNALNTFASFFDPQITSFVINTVGGSLTYGSLPVILTNFTSSAKNNFNGYSQQYAENVIVTPDLNSYAIAGMTSGGGEYANIGGGAQIFQHTITEWKILWKLIGDKWCISTYEEDGNALIQIPLPSGPNNLFWQRTFPGAIHAPNTSGQ